MEKHSFKDSRFEKSPGFRDKYTENIDAMPFEEKLKLDYIWVVETAERVKTQFTSDGDEIVYSEVRELAEQGKVEAAYWVPVEPETGDTIGVKGLKGKGLDFEMFRRGYKKVSPTGEEQRAMDRRCYVIRVGNLYCFVSDNGKTEVVNSRAYDMDKYL